ncbi:TPA: hypothetical protein DEW05_00935 [Candidatus Saccharibacteria bacterium]|nr:hypothetical protein [Candidatus Saccharibacteria bacterium]
MRNPYTVDQRVISVPNVRVIIARSTGNFVEEVLSFKRSDALAGAIRKHGLRGSEVDCELSAVSAEPGKVEVTMSRDIKLDEARVLYRMIGDIAVTGLGTRPVLCRSY